MHEVHRSDTRVASTSSVAEAIFADTSQNRETLKEQPALLVDIQGLQKDYAGMTALRGVDFQLAQGEVHALLGQNGAGKSTFIKVLAGVEQPTAGIMEVLGKEQSFASPRHARDAGIAVVYQELSLVPTMSVVDNLFLGREPQKSAGVVDRRAMLKATREFLEEYDFPLDPKALVGNLPFAYRQMTEIAKALMGKVRVLILDEPTSALSEHEEEVLFNAVRKVASRGVGVIHVTHRLSEVFSICDRVTVFRDGSNAGTFATGDVDMRGLVKAIVGPQQPMVDDLLAAEGSANASQGSPMLEAKLFDPTKPPVLELRNIENDKLSGVSLSVRAGEIVGLAGIIGSGRTEILETIFGLRRHQKGELLIDGSVQKPKSSADAIRLGIGLVPEDRHVQGLVLEHSIEKNLAMPVLPNLSRFGIFGRRTSNERAARTIKALSIKAPNPATPPQALSGGNQQKVVFGRWIEPKCHVLLLDEPTVGVDVGAREEIYASIRHAASEGAATLVASSDIDELLLLCDRIYVVHDSQVGEVVDRKDITNSEQLHHLIATHN